MDNLPAVKGTEQFYGRTIFHCPYCDGWEVKDQPLVIYGRGERACGLALELTLWSKQLTICTDGPDELSASDRERLLQKRISIRQEPVDSFEGKNGLLQCVRFVNGSELKCGALFFTLGQRQRSPLPAKLGCEFTEKGAVRTGKYESTCVPGLYVAGDASQDVQFAIVAASEGSQAAVAINIALLKEDIKE